MQPSRCDQDRPCASSAVVTTASSEFAPLLTHASQASLLKDTVHRSEGVNTRSREAKLQQDRTQAERLSDRQRFEQAQKDHCADRESEMEAKIQV
jgi:hypothetical protein